MGQILHGTCRHATRTLAAWANNDKSGGHVIGHYYNEVAPPPRCESHDLAKPEDWSLTPGSFVTSPDGIPFATSARLVVPSRKINLHAVQKVPGATVNPGVFEGVVGVQGTINGERIWGVAMFEELGARKPLK